MVFFTVVQGCKQAGDRNKILTDVNLLHQNTKQLTEVIIYDIFSPPVASRIYAYTSLAAYEAIRYAAKGYPSLTAQLHGFPEMPKPDASKKYNYLLASTKAFFTVAEKVTFAVDTLKQYQQKVFDDFKQALDTEEYVNSMAFGDTIGKCILKRTTVDSYKNTRGMPKYLGSSDAGIWRPTPHDYFDAIEPYWNLILPLAMDSASQFKPAPPPPFSKDTTGPFYNVMNEVYVISKNLTEEEKIIAKYWDDNPAVVEHSGHLMYVNKKITPVGHWVGITGIACSKRDLNEVEIAQAYAVTAIAFFDGFISCWDEKFRSRFIRPVTAINDLLDKNWQSFLQTPPFPEHTSGHSTVSAAAATVLTKRFGDNFAFEDTSDLEYIGMRRDFTSFFQAADEASISRVYGGIHYRTGVDEGAKNGRQIGEFINSKLKLRE